MNKVIRTGVSGLFLSLASVAVLAADPADFVDEASAKGIAEVEAGNLALRKSQSANVQAFAKMMVRDHTTANEQLKAIAASKSLKVRTEAELLDKAKALILDIRDESFDRSYATNQVKAHEEAIKLFVDEERNGQDAELRTFAKQTLPILRRHLTEARKLANSHTP